MPFYLIILLISLSASALAETPGEPSPDRWYDIEVLIFAQQPGQGESGNGQEVWPLDPGSPDLKEVIELAPAAIEGPGEDPTQPPLPFAEQPLTSWRLGDEDKRIRAGHNYALLSHLAWRQPAPPSEVALPIHIRIAPPIQADKADIVASLSPTEAVSALEPANMALPAPSPTLENESEATSAQVAETPPGRMSAPLIEGLIRISRNNYLHVDADLLYRTEVAGIDQLPAGDEQIPMELPPSLVALNSADLSLSVGEMAEQVPPTQFRMRQSRRVRKGELNYFDHPRFGLLVRIDPFEQALDTPPAE